MRFSIRCAVLVADHAHVEVAVDTGWVEGAGKRLPHVHVGDGRQTLGHRVHVGVVPHASGRAGLAVANDRVVLAPGLGEAEVDVLGVPIALGEAEEVRPVVHAVVRDEQVRHRRRVVPGRARGSRRRLAVTEVPVVRPREHVVAARARRPVAGRARDLGVDPGSRGDRVVPDRRQGRRVRPEVVIPRRTRGEVADDLVAVGGVTRVPAPELARVRARVPPGVAEDRGERWVGREHLPPREVRVRGGGVVDREGARVRPRLERCAENADLGEVVAGRHAAGRRVLDRLGREPDVGRRRDQGRAEVEAQEDVLPGVVRICEDPQKADAGAHGERAVPRGAAVRRGQECPRERDRHRGELLLGQVEDGVEPGEKPAVTRIDENPLAVARLLVDHERLVRRQNAQAGRREGDEPDVLERVGALDLERPVVAGLPAQGDVVGSEVLTRGPRRPSPPLRRRQLDAAGDEGLGARERGRDVGDPPAARLRAGQADRDEAAFRSLDAVEELPEADGVAPAPDEAGVGVEPKPGGRAEPEKCLVPLDPGSSRSDGVRSANARRQELPPLAQRGRRSEPVPRDGRSERLDGRTLCARRLERAATDVELRDILAVLDDRDGRSRHEHGRQHGGADDPQHWSCTHTATSPFSSH